jgi:hypothetical protein
MHVVIHTPSRTVGMKTLRDKSEFGAAISRVCVCVCVCLIVLDMEISKTRRPRLELGDRGKN